MSFLSLQRITLTAVAACLFLLNTPSDAATITIGTVTTNITVNGTAPSTGFEQDTADKYEGTQAGGRDDLMKIFGDKAYTAQGSGNAKIIVTVKGTINNIDAGEEIGLYYEFTLAPTGGTVNWSIATQVDFTHPQAGPQSVAGPTAGGTGINSANTSTHEINGQDIVNAEGQLAEAQFTATVTIDWLNFATNDQLDFNIPTNSIDFGVGAIPEPSSALLIALGSLLLFRRKRG